MLLLGGQEGMAAMAIAGPLGQAVIKKVKDTHPLLFPETA
jgi:hypothetical protein